MLQRPLRPLLCALATVVSLPSLGEAYRWTDSSGRTVISDIPPSGGSRNVSQLNGSAQPNDGLSAAARKAAENFPVTLYTAAECDSCKQGRELLAGRGIPFTEKVIKTPEEFDELKKLIGDGYVPTLKVGKQTQRGFESNTWQNMLDYAGYPKGKGK